MHFNKKNGGLSYWKYLPYRNILVVQIQWYKNIVLEVNFSGYLTEYFASKQWLNWTKMLCIWIRSILVNVFRIFLQIYFKNGAQWNKFCNVHCYAYMHFIRHCQQTYLLNVFLITLFLSRTVLKCFRIVYILARSATFIYMWNFNFNYWVLSNWPFTTNNEDLYCVKDNIYI